jgi:hypothetical protein
MLNVGLSYSTRTLPPIRLAASAIELGKLKTSPAMHVKSATKATNPFDKISFLQFGLLIYFQVLAGSYYLLLLHLK